MFKLKKKGILKNTHSTGVEIPVFLKNNNNEKLYTYVSIIYDDDIVATTIGEPSFYYKTDIDDIDIDDKVLVDRNGKVVARYSPTYKPEDMEEKIKELL